MWNEAYIQRLPVKIIFFVLIILQLFVIASRFTINFSQYVSFIAVLLNFPLAFFGFYYIKFTRKKAVDTERFSGQTYRKVENGEDLTKREVDKLISSPAFKEYQEKKLKREAEQSQQTEEQRAKFAEIEQQAQEIEDKQTQIFTA